MSQGEVNCVKGPPTDVIDVDASDNFGGHPMIKVSKLDQGRTAEDFREWSYQMSEARIDVAFDADKKVKSIRCYSEGYLNCPSVFGLHDGSSEEEVTTRLGKPTSAAVQQGGVAKRMVYEPYNVVFYLTKKKVYMIDVTADLLK